MAEEGNEVIVEVEKNARHFGWVPKEEFRGREEDWVDAETFEKRGKEINPILRANNERLKKELEATTTKHNNEIAELREAAEEFKTFQKESFERKQTQLQEELQALKSQRKEAMRDNDVDLLEQIEDRIDEVKEEQNEKPVVRATPKSETVILDPSLSEWIDNNKWFGVDVENTEIVNALGSAIRRQFPNLQGKEFLDKLDERIEQRLPEMRANPNQERSSVDSSSTRGSASKKKSYDSLPSDAKAACDKYVSTGLKLNPKTDKATLTKEYTDLYFD